MLLLILLTFLLRAIYIFLKLHYTKWQRLGIPTDKSVKIPYGSLYPVMRRQRSLGQLLEDIYNNYQDKYVGIYMFFKPALLVRDVKLIQQIMITNFASFHDRGIYVNEKIDPMSAHLLALKGQQWRTLRSKFASSFTSGKLKDMFETVDDVANKMIKHISRVTEDGETHSLEIKSISTTYAVDVIGSVIFGLDIDSFTNPKNEFRLINDLFFTGGNSSVFMSIVAVATFICPPIASVLAFFGFKNPAAYALREIVKRTIEFREKNGVVRKDLLQLMLENDQLWNVQSAAGDMRTKSFNMIASNLFLFYMAGSTTTGEAITYAMYELSMYPEILEKAQKEVDQCLEKHELQPDGRFTYDAIQDMKYLELCVKEITRKYPGLPLLNRECTQDFKVPGTDFVIKKGTAIIISLMGMHRDGEHFLRPTDFWPERFLPEQMSYNPDAFMPFGEGPRQCIAQRMGMVNTKLALAKILANYFITPMPRKEVEFIFDSSAVLKPKNSLRVSITKRW